jgi:hypothetical protein
MDGSQESVVDLLKLAFRSLSKKFPGSFNTEFIDNMSRSFAREVIAKSDPKNTEHFIRFLRRVALKIISMDEKILDRQLDTTITPG